MREELTCSIQQLHDRPRHHVDSQHWQERNEEIVGI